MIDCFLCRKLSPDAPGLVLYELEHFGKEETDGEKIRAVIRSCQDFQVFRKRPSSLQEKRCWRIIVHSGEEASEYLKTVDLEPFVRTD